MKITLKALSVFAVLATMAAPALAGGNDERADKVVFDRLVRELRQTHQEYADTYQRGVNEARDGDGQATTETKAEILSLRDEIDRKMTRLTLIALRHGWEVPDFDPEDPGSTEPAPSRKERIFSPVDDLIRRAFATEARHMAAEVRLPVVSISAAGAEEPEESKPGRAGPFARKDD